MKRPELFIIAGGLAGLLCGTLLKDCHAEQIIPRRDLSTVTVTVEWHSQQQVKIDCAAKGAWGGVVPRHTDGPVGCTSYNPATNVCTVYATRPEEVDDDYTRVLGHEVLHCFTGAYHSQDSIN